MKDLELNLVGVKKKSELADRVKDLMGYPDWEGNRMDDWLKMLTAHQGAVPHLRCDNPEKFSLVIVNSDQVANAAILQMVRWVVKINRRATGMGFAAPLALSIE